MNVALLLLSGLFLVADRGDAEPLKSPLIAMPAATASAGAKSCPSAPAPVEALGGVSYYVDAHRSVANPALRSANEKMQRPALIFVDGVTRSSDAWRRSGGRDASAAVCAAAWLDAWARVDALSGTLNASGGYQRSWHLSGLALAWLKVRDAPGIDEPQRQRITAWLAGQAQRVIDYYRDPARARDARNNHGDWAALAVAVAAVAADDARLFDWAEQRFRTNLSEIAADGSLPLEVDRGERALHYHLFALTPLTLMARIEEANGRQFDRAALARLEAFTRAGLEDPQVVARLAGVAQEIPRPDGDPSEFVWAVLASARPGPALERLLSERGALSDRRTGGDVRLTWPIKPQS